MKWLPKFLFLLLLSHARRIPSWEGEGGKDKMFSNSTLIELDWLKKEWNGLNPSIPSFLPLSMYHNRNCQTNPMYGSDSNSKWKGTVGLKLNREEDREYSKDRIKSNQVESSRIKSNQIKSNQIELNWIKSNQIKSNQVKSSQVKSNQIKSIDTTHFDVKHL